MEKSSSLGRVAIILTGGLLALWIAVGITLDLAFPRSANPLARAVWPFGVTPQVVEATLVTSDPNVTKETVGRQSASLRRAIVRDPIDTQALSALAMIEEYSGNEAQARKLFLLSEAASRRNTLSQIWLVEDAVGRGDVEGAIRHYDRAMRVSVDARTSLLPVLVKASSEPGILQALLPVVKQRPLWWKDYLNKLALSGTDANVMASVLRATSPDLRRSDERYLAERTLRRMIALGAGAEATVAANRLEHAPGSVRSLQNGNFEVSDNILPFAWWLKDDGSIRAYRDVVPNGTLGLRVEAGAGASGLVAQQFIGLRPGRYVLKGVSGGVAADITARPSVELTCGDGERFAKFTLPPSPDQGGPFSFAFEIPSTACTVQSVMIVTAPAVDTSIWLDNLSIAR